MKHILMANKSDLYWDILTQQKLCGNTLMMMMMMMRNFCVISTLTYNKGKAVYISESCLYGLILRSRLPAAKSFKKSVTADVLPSIRKTGSYELQALKNELKDKTHQEELKKAMTQLTLKYAAIKEKDAVFPLLNDVLQAPDNQIQAIQYENVVLEAQKDVYQAQLQKWQDIIIHFKTCYVSHARDPSKDNIIIIVQKHTRPVNDKFHDLPY